MNQETPQGQGTKTPSPNDKWKGGPQTLCVKPAQRPPQTLDLGEDAVRIDMYVRHWVGAMGWRVAVALLVATSLGVGGLPRGLRRDFDLGGWG